jgi:hypothetical protein
LFNKLKGEKMKKIMMLSILGMLLIGFITPELNAYYKRVTINGRDNGPGQPPTYNYVRVIREPGRTDIWCENPGPEACPYSVVGPGRDKSPATDAEQSCVDYALEQINQGNLTGKWVNPENNYTVEWEKTGVDVNIKVWGPGETIPQ